MTDKPKWRFRVAEARIMAALSLWPFHEIGGRLYGGIIYDTPVTDARVRRILGLEVSCDD